MSAVADLVTSSAIGCSFGGVCRGLLLALFRYRSEIPKSRGFDCKTVGVLTGIELDAADDGI